MAAADTLPSTLCVRHLPKLGPSTESQSLSGQQAPWLLWAVVGKAFELEIKFKKTYQMVNSKVFLQKSFIAFKVEPTFQIRRVKFTKKRCTSVT